MRSTTTRSADPAPYVAIILILLGTALRTWSAVSLPFEQDELYTVLESRDLFATTLQPGIDARPLYYLLQHPLLDLFPVSPVGLRILPLLFSVAGLVATYSLAARLGGRRAGTIAIGLLAVSPWHLHVSSFARYWSLVYLLTVLCSIALLEIHGDERASRRWFALAFLCSLAGFATHPTFAFGWIGLVLGFHLRWTDGRLRIRWPSAREWKLLWGPLCVATGVGVAALVVSGGGAAVQNFGGRGLAATLRLIPAIVQWITPVQFAAGAMGAVACVASPATRRWGLAAVLGAVSLLALLALAAFRTDTYADYAVALVALAIVSSAVGIASLGGETRDGSLLRTAAVLLMLAGILPSTVSHLIDGTRFDYRPALAVAKDLAPADPIVGQPEILMRYYAPGSQHLPYRVSAAGLDATLRQAPRFWLLLSAREYGFTLVEADTESWVARHCRRVRGFARMRLDSRQYRVVLFSCGAELVGPTET